MPETKEIEAAAEAIRETMSNMYGDEPLDLDDRYQIARAALHAAAVATGATVVKDGDTFRVLYITK